MSEFYDLPNGWEWKSLSYCVLNPKQDIVDGPFGSNLKASEYTNSGIPIIRLQNIDRFRFIDKDIKYVSKSKAEELKRHSYQKGDLVITKLGMPLGKCCTISESNEFGIIVADIVRVRINENKTVKKFIEYAINSNIAIDQLSDLTKGTTRPRVNLNHIRDLKIPLPLFSEQQRIVSKLDLLFAKIDKSIELHQKNMDEADAFMGSILNEVFGELEENYHSKTLKEVSNIISGYAFKSEDFSTDNEIKSIKITNVGVQNFVEEDDNFLPKDLLTKLSKYRAKYGDIVIALTRPYISNGLKVTYVPKSYDGAFINQRVAAIQSNNTFTTNNYIYHYLCTSTVLTNVMELSKTLNQPNLSIKDLSDFTIPTPPLSIQQKVVDYLDSVSEKMEKVKSIQKEKMDSLKALKASILDRAFRGEL